MLNGKWIEYPQIDAPEFYKSFTLAKMPETAKISICGLGFFELKINGKRVSDDYLVPAWSDYEPRQLSKLSYPINDTFTHRVYYLEYDVTEYLFLGKNEITVILGNGWYNETCRTVEGKLDYGKPKLCFDLAIDENIHIISDEDTAVSESIVIFNDIYYGEKQDFRNISEYKHKASLANAPKAEIVKQYSPADKIHRIIHPKKIASTASGEIYDCGENISGWAVFAISSKSGDSVTVRYAEEFDGKSLDYASAGGTSQIQSDSYISDGSRQICRPKFTFHGFRYFEIDGEFEDLTVEVVYADVETIADFKCENEIITKLFDNFIRTQSTNMHCSVPSDCPHRERLGYTGDGQLICDAAMKFFDCRDFYRKWIRDIADCQNIKNGHIQHTAPFNGGGGGPGGWGCAIIMVPYFYYKNYKDKELLKEYFPNMLKWCDYMESRSENGIVMREEDGGWCLGDWGVPEGMLLPEPYVNTYYFIKALGFLEEICDILSYDKSEISAKRQKILDSFRKTYYDEANNTVLDGVQGAEAFFADLIPNKDMVNAMNNRYSKKGKLDTGIFGADVLIRLLFENGYSATAVMLMENTFKDQIEKGATTLWEYMNGESSHNHPMYGACVKYLITELMGIKKDDIVTIAPKPALNLKNASASLKINDRDVNVSYEIKKKKIEITVFSECEAVLCYNGNEFKLPENNSKTFVFDI